MMWGVMWGRLGKGRYHPTEKWMEDGWKINFLLYHAILSYCMIPYFSITILTPLTTVCHTAHNHFSTQACLFPV